MAISEITDPLAVRSAMEEFRTRGRNAFLAQHGFRKARRFFIRDEQGELYDSKAVLGVAHGYQFPDRGPLRAIEFSGGEETVKKELKRLGFEVVEQLTLPGLPEGEAAGRRVWIEKTIVRGRPDREAGDHMLGLAIWSPQESADGRDIYASIREVSPGDLVLHLTDNEGFTGISEVASEVDDTFQGVPGTAWGDRHGYRVQLKDFQAIEPALARSWLLDDPTFTSSLEVLLRRPGRRPLFYNQHFELNQGAYFTEAP